MRKKIALYVHLIWRTWDSLPLITPAIEPRLYRNIHSEANQAGCTVLALNGALDHIHLVITLPTTVAIADLMKQIKGVSSHFVNDKLNPDGHFQWQGGYGAFSVSRWDLDKVIHYVKRQKKHHQTANLWAELERAVEFTKASSASAQASAQADARS
jgi:REP element-mobilizing transposase RayT